MTASEPPIPPSVSPDAAAPAGLRLLVVEDDDEARGALRMLLEFRGYTVAEAADGDGGIAHALAHRPEVAVIDIGLPGRLDGYGVVRGIREGLAGAPMFLIALTGYQELDEPARDGTAGFDAHLVKPLKFEQLYELLDRVAARTTRPA